jgi:neurofibromin 1
LKTLHDYPNWGEISTLVRLCHVAGYQAQRPSHNLLYVPEILHLVTLTVGVGPPLVRKAVYGIIINLLQAVYIGRTEDAPSPELQQLLSDCELPETMRLFGLQRATPSSEYANFDISGDVARVDVARVDAQEKLTELLARILEITAGSMGESFQLHAFGVLIALAGLLNVWRARWMGLATSSAFQYSPAIQMRSFTTLGALLTLEADDDYLYQMLVALRTAFSQTSETDTTIVITMLRSLAKVVPALPDNSRYLVQLFWLAVAMLESSHVSFFIEAARLLSVTLESMRARDMFRHASVVSVLMEGRDSLEEILGQLDTMLCVSFETHFSFALASIIFKGMRPSILREAAEGVLRTLLSVTMKPHISAADATEADANGVREALLPDALGYFVALIPVATTHGSYRRLLKEWCHLGDAWMPEASGLDEEVEAPRVQTAFLGIDSSTTALLAASFIGSVLTTAQGNDAETEMLYRLLSDIAASYPEIVAMMYVRFCIRFTCVDFFSFSYDGLQDKIRDIFAKSSNPAIIQAVTNIFRIAQEHDRPRFGTTLNRAGGGSSSTLSTVDEASSVTFTPGRSHLEALEELGMGGLAGSFLFLTGGHATKMIQWIPELVNLMVQ